MPTFGGFGGFPLKFGGGNNHRRTLYDALNQARGTAYDTTDDSNVTADTYAQAIALEAVWSANRKMANQWDPRRMTDFIPRWEAIFDIHPSASDSLNARRAVLSAKFRALAGQQTLTDIVSAMLGGSFVGVEYTPIAQAYMRWPENGYPTDWISHTAHILIRVQFAQGQTENEFLRLMAQLDRFLRDYLPAYTTWDWGMFAENGLDGFYLDDPLGAGPPPANLGYETFDI